jgi:hypothetical protein
MIRPSTLACKLIITCFSIKYTTISHTFFISACHIVLTVIISFTVFIFTFLIRAFSIYLVLIFITKQSYSAVCVCIALRIILMTSTIGFTFRISRALFADICCTFIIIYASASRNFLYNLFKRICYTSI